MWLLGVVVRRYIDFLILLIPTPLVSVPFCGSIPTFCSFFNVFHSCMIINWECLQKLVLLEKCWYMYFASAGTCILQVLVHVFCTSLGFQVYLLIDVEGTCTCIHVHVSSFLNL